MQRPFSLTHPALRPWLLLGEGLLWLAVAIGLAFALEYAVEAVLPPSTWTAYEDTYCFRASSDSYGRLYDWLTAQPETGGVDVAWHKPCITVSYRRPVSMHALAPPWKALGFTPPLKVRKESKAVSYVASAGGKWVRLIFERIGILLAGFVGLWVAKRRGVPLLPLLRRNAVRAVAIGVIVGCALVAFDHLSGGPLNDLARQFLPGWKPQGMPPEEFHVGPVAALAYLSLLVPVSEEILFRALIFGRIASVGYTVFGVVASAAIFAAMHMDPWNFVGLFITGIALAEVYRRSGSLIAPIIAHGIVNGLPFFFNR